MLYIFSPSLFSTLLNVDSLKENLIHSKFLQTQASSSGNASSIRNWARFPMSVLCSRSMFSFLKPLCNVRKTTLFGIVLCFQVLLNPLFFQRLMEKFAQSIADAGQLKKTLFEMEVSVRSGRIKERKFCSCIPSIHGKKLLNTNILTSNASTIRPQVLTALSFTYEWSRLCVLFR